MRSLVVLLLLSGAFAGCSTSAEDERFPGPYHLAIRLDGQATRGEVEIDGTLKQGETTLDTFHHQGSARVDRDLYNLTVPQGVVRIDYTVAYSYQSDGGGSSTNVNRHASSAVLVDPSNCGTGAHLTLVVSNGETTWVSACEGPTRSSMSSQA